MYVTLANPNDSQNPTNISEKYGRPNESTPAKWNAEYKDFTAPLEYVGPETAQLKIELKPEPAEEEAGAVSTIKPAIVSPPEKGDTKKRKRHEGETPEERAERKRKKKEKKEKRKSKKDMSDDGSE